MRMFNRLKEKLGHRWCPYAHRTGTLHSITMKPHFNVESDSIAAIQGVRESRLLVEFPKSLPKAQMEIIIKAIEQHTSYEVK